MSYVTSSTGRSYWVDEKGVAHRVLEAELAAEEGEAERRAEFAMNWVMGGGHPDDIGAAYRQHTHGVAHVPEDGGVCEHGLSLSLCAGPEHYPIDY